jgi:hypothetical protein
MKHLNTTLTMVSIKKQLGDIKWIVAGVVATLSAGESSWQ